MARRRQFNALICVVNLAILPVIIADKVANLALATVVSFCAISFLFGLNEVARDLEDPFATSLGGVLGANRLHAPLLQTHFDQRLMAVAGRTPEEWLAASDGLYGPFLHDAMSAATARKGETGAGTSLTMCMAVESRSNI